MSQAGSVISEAAGSGTLRHIAALLPRPDSRRLEFGIKTAIAVLMAVGIEFCFSLGMAGSAALTVLIVNSNLLGATIAKSVLRMIGNLIGCSIGLAFLGMVDQDRTAAAILFTMYCVFCCFNLQRSRFAPAWHWAYTSAGLVFLTHIGSPTNSFTYAVERWLEIAIGISAITIVGSVLWPARAGKVFERQFTAMLANLAALISSSRDALTSTDSSAPHRTAGKFATGLPALRNALRTASRDTSRYERFHDGYEALISRIESLVARSTLLANAVDDLNATTDASPPASHLETIAPALDQLKASLNTTVEIAKRHFDDAATRDGALDAAAVHSAVQRISADAKTAEYSFRDASAMFYIGDRITSVADELDRFADELVKVERNPGARPKLSAVQQLDSDTTPFWKRVDVRKSLACGLIIGLAVVAWIMTNWPSGSLAVFMALLVTSKHCTAPYLPPKAMLPGGALAVLVGAVIYFCVLPRLDGFWQLAIVLFPFYVICGYLILSANAKTAGLAALTAIFATMTFDLQQQQSYSWGNVVGLAYAIIGGMSLAFIVLTIVWPIVPEKMFIGQVKGIFKSCGQWLRMPTSNSAVDPASSKAFASASAKQLGLSRLWGGLMNYTRLPANSRNAVTDLVSSIQLTTLRLVELEDARRRWTNTSQAGLLTDISQRFDRQFCEVFDEFVRALERTQAIPELPDAQVLLRTLQDEFDKLGDNADDDESSAAEAREILAMTGRYTALSNTIAECHACLRKLDWKTLNQDYF